MANYTVSPNMNLTIPTPGVDPGPDYATNISNSLTIIDGHNHSAGYGNQINPSGININTDLPFNGFNATLLNTTRYVNLSGSLAGTSPNLNCLYVAGGELYFNDGAGNVDQITLSGAVNATSSGISSGTATASFSGGTLVVNSASLTPADIQCGSVLIGNVSASSNFATLSCPSSLGANYGLTLPPTNGLGITGILTYDTSNNITPVGAGGIAATYITSGSITNTQVSSTAAIARTKLGIKSYSVGSSSGVYSNATGTPSTVCSVSITTQGNPIYIGLQTIGGTSPAVYITGTTNPSGGSSFLQLSNGTSLVYLQQITVPQNASQYSTIPGFLAIDPQAAGTYTYTLQGYIAGSGSGLTIEYAQLVAYEL